MGYTLSGYTWHTCEVFSSLGVSFSLLVSESIIKVPCHFVGLVFTLSESEIYSEEISSSKTQVYMVLKQSEEVST